MRRALLVAFVAILGCGRPAPPPPAPSSARDVETPRDADGQAAYGLDAAGAAVEEALAKTKTLIPSAGGDAKQALQDVADGLNEAGEDLADHTDPPPAGKALTDAERKATAEAAASALGELRDARDILDGLAQDAPKEFDAPLAAIRGSVEEAADAVEGAIKDLGAKVPPEGS